MQKIIISLTIFLLLSLSIISISGCIDTTTKNHTWGEKTISKDLIKIVNSTGEHQNFGGQNFYYVSVTVRNENTNDAMKTELLVEGFDKNGQLVAKESNPYIKTATDETDSGTNENTGSKIPAKSESTFYYLLQDPDNKIVNYTVTLVNAQANYI